MLVWLQLLKTILNQSTKLIYLNIHDYKARLKFSILQTMIIGHCSIPHKNNTYFFS